MDGMSDLISKQEVINLYKKYQPYLATRVIEFGDALQSLPSAQPETCEGCRHLGKWENEVEYGYPSPCTYCKRRAVDYYER